MIRQVGWHAILSETGTGKVRVMDVIVSKEVVCSHACQKIDELNLIVCLTSSSSANPDSAWPFLVHPWLNSE